jgi:fatty acid desaturase
MWRRCVDWLDWMLVEAWNVEHNQLHHYCLGEVADPDLVENNLQGIREAPGSKAYKYAVVGFFMMTWKWFYYAPNTFKMLKVHEMRRKGLTPTFDRGNSKYKKGDPVPPHMLTAPWVISPTWFKRGALFYTASEFFVRVLGPFFVRQFVLIPMICGLVGGQTAWFNALVSMALAEIGTNIHSFVVIVTNHAGDDLYRFDRHCTARSSTFYLRQIISSANFSMGTDLIDFHHGWLNYQVEHHLWPDLSMLSYQKSAPLVKSICKKHGVPYIQQNVFWRVKKTVDIMVGNASMRKFPSKWEREADLTSLDGEASSSKLE